MLSSAVTKVLGWHPFPGKILSPISPFTLENVNMWKFGTTILYTWLYLLDTRVHKYLYVTFTLFYISMCTPCAYIGCYRTAISIECIAVTVHWKPICKLQGVPRKIHTALINMHTFWCYPHICQLCTSAELPYLLWGQALLLPNQRSSRHLREEMCISIHAVDTHQCWVPNCQMLR